MEFQLDLKPESRFDESLTSYGATMYIDGHAFEFLASKSTVDELLNSGIVKQVKGTKRDNSGNIIEFDYENKIDSAGVQYTSRVYEITSK